MSHYLKITLHDERDRAAIEKLRPYSEKDGGEAAAGKRWLLIGMGLYNPVTVDVEILRRIIREEIQATREVFEEVKASG